MEEGITGRKKEEGRKKGREGRREGKKGFVEFFLSFKAKNLSTFWKKSLPEPCHEAIHTSGHWSISLSEFKYRFLASDFYFKALIINIYTHM